MKHLSILLLSLLLLSACTPQPTQVASPNGQILLTFALNSQGQPQYQIQVNDQSIIDTSLLGFTSDQGLNLCDGFTIKDVQFSQSDEVYTLPWGENKTLRDYHNAMTLQLQNPQHILLTLTFRVFDDGVGLRYHYTVPHADSLRLTDELTEFNFALNGTSWSIPANFETYELTYRQLPIAEVTDANTPFTLQFSDSLYASIHEAALTDFPEMTLFRTAPHHFKAHLASWPDGIKARFDTNTFQSPWRTIQIASEAVGLINSSLILNLNEPCALASTDWIHPMKYIGIWWGMHLGINSWVINDRHGATTENALRYIDFAARNHIQAVLFEGWNQGWENWGGNQTFRYTQPYADFDIDSIVHYAQSKGIQLISHHETGGNVPFYESQMDSAYQWLVHYGIHNLKTGYAGGYPNGHSHHGQYAVRHYRKVVETAAQYHITINAHEPIKPTGIRRTYPNMMTREGARGMEWNAWSQGNAPNHHTILPFTRLLAGPMDYTPGIFDLTYQSIKHNPHRKQWNQLDSKDCRCHTTLAKQIANWVVLYSPLQMASDLIENYEHHPAFQFFRDYNPDCDASLALNGQPGQYVTIVRQAGYHYYLGAITNQEPRTLQVSLQFLNGIPQPLISNASQQPTTKRDKPLSHTSRRYQATIYADAPDAHYQTNPQAYQIQQQIVTPNDTLTLYLAPGGGQAITFTPIE